MDIRQKTCLVVKKGTEYLVGISVAGGLRWSGYIYDAWHTRDRKAAKYIAKRVGGELILFNPLAGQVGGLNGENV